MNQSSIKLPDPRTAEEWLGMFEASRRINVHPPNMAALCRQGRVHGVKWATDPVTKRQVRKIPCWNGLPIVLPGPERERFKWRVLREISLAKPEHVSKKKKTTKV